MSRDMRFPTMLNVRPAKPQISLRRRAVWSEHLLVDWIFCDCKATNWTSLVIPNLKTRLHRLLRVYSCQNATLLEITGRGSIIMWQHTRCWYLSHRREANDLASLCICANSQEPLLLTNTKYGRVRKPRLNAMPLVPLDICTQNCI